VPDGDGNHGLGSAARDVAEHASTLTRLELELAVLELKDRAVSFSVGIGLGVGAAAFALLAVCVALAAVAAAIATSLSVWLSLLIVAGALLVVAGIAGAIGIGKLKGGKRALPAKAIHEAKLTSKAFKR
jgi:membrane protein